MKSFTRSQALISKHFLQFNIEYIHFVKQENPAVADKPARRESMPKVASIRRAYNVVADITGLSLFV